MDDKHEYAKQYFYNLVNKYNLRCEDHNPRAIRAFVNNTNPPGYSMYLWLPREGDNYYWLEISYYSKNEKDFSWMITDSYPYHELESAVQAIDDNTKMPEWKNYLKLKYNF